MPKYRHQRRRAYTGTLNHWRIWRHAIMASFEKKIITELIIGLIAFCMDRILVMFFIYSVFFVWFRAVN